MSEMNNIMGNVEDVDISLTAREKFLDYGMSVITDRALPDSRDGLKPVHRRILFSMHKLGTKHNRPHKKSARIVGDVIGKYHPHGDASVYDAMVRMAQDFSMKTMLVDGQGNFGSIDGDNPAAMRYTEARMSVFGENMFTDLDLNTVSFADNYDGTESEPTVLPTSFPNLLINGVQGIAVGMASSIPPHNPIEVLNCVNYLMSKRIANESPVLEELMEIMPAPDFPTGGIVHGLSDMKAIWETGRGSVQLRAEWHEEELESGKTAIIITEIPYQVNKSNLIQKIVDLAKPNKAKMGKIEVEGIFEVRDESDKDGLRIFIGVKKDFEPELVFNSLAKLTQLDRGISYNNTVLCKGSPKVMGLLELFNEFIEHRLDVINRRTLELDKRAQDRQYILSGLIKALSPDVIDQVIQEIKSSKDSEEATAKLMNLLEIDEVQSASILQMRLQKLTSTQVEDLRNEYADINAKREYYAKVLDSDIERSRIIISETESQIDNFANAKDKTGQYMYIARASSFVEGRINVDLAALTKREECNIFLTANGYLKRLSLETVDTQNRGTRGKRQMTLSDDDFITHSLQCHSHDTVMVVTERGQTYSIKAYEIADNSRGRHCNNILSLLNGDRIIKLFVVDLDNDKESVLMCTRNGLIKKSPLTLYKGSMRKGGLIGINLKEDDSVVFASSCSETDNVVIVNSIGNSIQFKVSDLRLMSRNTYGVTAMKLKDDSYVIGGSVVGSSDQGYLITIGENGVVKVSLMSQYRLQSRGGTGIKAMKQTEKTGSLFSAIYSLDLEGDLVSVSKKGVSNRVSLSSINVTSRTTSGVYLCALDEGDSLAEVILLPKIDEEILNED